MKRVNRILPRIFFSLCLISAASLAGCSSDLGDDSGDGDAGDGDTGDGDASGGTTGATGGTTGDGDSTNETPADSTQASIEAFLTAQTYRAAPWVGDAAIRASDNSVNVHGEELRVFFNTKAVESIARNSGSSDVDTMVVKEIYEAGALVGHAVYLKTGTGDTMNDWTYYCQVPDGSTACSGGDETTPLYGTGLTECGFCHGQVPYAPVPQ